MRRLTKLLLTSLTTLLIGCSIQKQKIPEPITIPLAQYTTLPLKNHSLPKLFRYEQAEIISPDSSGPYLSITLSSTEFPNHPSIIKKFEGICIDINHFRQTSNLDLKDVKNRISFRNSLALEYGFNINEFDVLLDILMLKEEDLNFSNPAEIDSTFTRLQRERFNPYSILYIFINDQLKEDMFIVPANNDADSLASDIYNLHFGKNPLLPYSPRFSSLFQGNYRKLTKLILEDKFEYNNLFIIHSKKKTSDMVKQLIDNQSNSPFDSNEMNSFLLGHRLVDKSGLVNERFIRIGEEKTNKVYELIEYYTTSTSGVYVRMSTQGLKHNNLLTTIK